MAHTPWLLITKHPRGRRVYILDRRAHHGRAGLILIALGITLHPLRSSRWLCSAGLLMALHDWSDRPWPTKDPQ